MANVKANVLLVGGGAVGTIGAVNIEEGGLGAVTMVLRSNYKAVSEFGYQIESVDHGKLAGWRPTKSTPAPQLMQLHILLTCPIVLDSVPNAPEESPYDYIVCATKNCPDIPPTLVDLIKPAVTPGKTVIVMVQNGLNIERPMFKAFPKNIVLSGVSMIDAHEEELGHIVHEDFDMLMIGPFHNPNLEEAVEEAAAQAFIKMYGAAGKSNCTFCEDVPWARWRKLVFNACYNPVCAITGLDDARMRLADDVVDTVVRPAMEEIVQVATAMGHILPEDIIEKMIHLDPIDLYLKPSMQCDSEKVRSLLHTPLIDLSLLSKL